MPKYPDTVIEEWKAKISLQRASGLSLTAWCKQNNIPTYQFFYWRKKLLPKVPVDRSSFIEIPTSKRSDNWSGIQFECQGIFIHIEKQFDPSVLRQCLKALKGELC